jgi:alpha-tubulin suppressor-like RCC1 family protein
VYHSLARKSDGTIVAWGDGGFIDVLNVPQDLTNVLAVAIGNSYGMVLLSDGTVRVWGKFSNTQFVPPGLSNVIAISAGYEHALALKSDGTVVGWGWNTDGQVTVPQSLSNVVAIAAGWHDSFALRSDGTICAWGAKGYGQTNVPPGLTNVIAISAGRFHSTALAFELKSVSIEPRTEGAAIRFHTFPGQQYNVESSYVPGGGIWTPIPGGTLWGDGSDATVLDTDVAEAPARFYRVRRSP